MKGRITLPKRMRVYYSCTGNFMTLTPSRGERAKGERPAIGAFENKILDLKDRLAISLVHAEGHYLLVKDFSEETERLEQQWAKAFKAARLGLTERDKAHARKKAEALEEDLQKLIFHEFGHLYAVAS